MHVLEHEEERRPGPGCGKQFDDCAVQSMSLCVRIGRPVQRENADDVREVRQEADQLRPCASELGAELELLMVADEVIESFDYRAIRRPDDGVARAVENQGALAADIMGELTNQPALAGSRLARQESDPTAFAFAAGKQGAKGGELTRTARERERRS